MGEIAAMLSLPLVENAISGIKRFNILVHAFRNHKDNMEDDSIALAAGLWNFLLL
ncbi:MAG: hypothetical protein HQK70_15280 [Desulfamplus sp.]|nr:hypothetical protein [Desulfamplus sp.]